MRINVSQGCVIPVTEEPMLATGPPMYATKRLRVYVVPPCNPEWVEFPVSSTIVSSTIISEGNSFTTILTLRGRPFLIKHPTGVHSRFMLVSVVLLTLRSSINILFTSGAKMGEQGWVKLAIPSMFVSIATFNCCIHNGLRTCRFYVIIHSHQCYQIV